MNSILNNEIYFMFRVLRVMRVTPKNFPALWTSYESVLRIFREVNRENLVV